MKRLLSIVATLMFATFANAGDCRVQRSQGNYQVQTRLVAVPVQEQVQETSCYDLNQTQVQTRIVQVPVRQYQSQSFQTQSYYQAPVQNFQVQHQNQRVVRERVIVRDNRVFADAGQNTTTVETRSTGLRRLLGGGDTKVTTSNNGLSQGNGGGQNVTVTPTFFRGNKVRVNN